MLDNRMRRELLTKARQSGFPGSILDVYSAYEQGRDLIAEYEQQQKVQQTQQMSDLAAQQSGMMQQAPSMPEQQLPQMPSFPPSVKANIPQAPESTTQNLVSSEQSQPVGMSTSKQGPRGGQLLLAKGGFKPDPPEKLPFGMLPPMNTLAPVEVKATRFDTSKYPDLGINQPLPTYRPIRKSTLEEEVYWNQVPDFYKKWGKDGIGEDVLEFLDPTGIMSHDDAKRAYESWKESGRKDPTPEEGLEMFGAVPALGKFGKIKYIKNGVKPVTKYIPWQQILNTVGFGKDMSEQVTEDKKAKGGFKGDPEKPKKKNILYVESKNDPRYIQYEKDLSHYNKQKSKFETLNDLVKTFGTYDNYVEGFYDDAYYKKQYNYDPHLGYRFWWQNSTSSEPDYAFRKPTPVIYQEPLKLEPKGIFALPTPEPLPIIQKTLLEPPVLPSSSYGVTDLGGNIGMIRKDNGVVGYVPLDKFFGTSKLLDKFYSDPNKKTKQGYSISRSDFDEWSSNVPIRGNVGDVQWDIYDDNEREYRNRVYKSKMAKGGFEKEPAKPDPTKPRGRKSDFEYKIIEGKYVFTLPDGRPYTVDNKDTANKLSKFIKSGKWGWISEEEGDGYAFGRLGSDSEPKAPKVFKKEKPDSPDFTYQIRPTYGNMANLIYNPRVYTSDYNIDTEWGNREGSGLMYTEPYQERSFYRNQEYPDYENISLKPRARGNYAYSVIIDGEEYSVDHPYEGPHKGYGYVNIPNRGEFEIDYRSGKPELKKSPTRLNKGGFEECYTCNRNKLKRYSK
jgi:hypothetical protein